MLDVYFLRGKASAKKARKRRVAKAAMAATTKASSNGLASKPDAITMIREVRALAEKAGGYEKLKEVVEALAD